MLRIIIYDEEKEIGETLVPLCNSEGSLNIGNFTHDLKLNNNKNNKFRKTGLKITYALETSYLENY